MPPTLSQTKISSRPAACLSKNPLARHRVSHLGLALATQGLQLRSRTMKVGLKFFRQRLQQLPRRISNALGHRRKPFTESTPPPSGNASSSISGESENTRSSCSADTFCVLAFNHLQLAPNGTAKMCCIAEGDICDDAGEAMTLYRNTYEEIWNSRYMREARQGMAVGERISACKRCYHEEETLGTSRRTQMNAAWLAEAQSKDKIIAEAEASRWHVKARPTFLQLNLGSLCNLACRMCGSFYSSRIASDPIHNKWMPVAHIDAARWSGDRLAIGPRPTFGVKAEGFYDYEAHPDRPLRWSQGNGHLIFKPDAGTTLRRLGLRLSGAKPNQGFNIFVNGRNLYQGTIGTEPVTLEFDLQAFKQSTEFDIGLTSQTITYPGDARKLGLALLEATLYREPSRETVSPNIRAFSRFDRGGGWWTQPEVIYGELLSQPSHVRRLIFQGGEPLLIREVEEIFEYLVAHESAKSVTIELTSNMTIVSERTLNNLKHFEKLDAGCSIDGIGDDLEYIRYGAKWIEVEKNIRRFAQLPNARVSFNVAVQFYNLMRITDLYRYCDCHQIQVSAHFLVGPYHLSVLVMPPEARQIALQRLKTYLREETVLAVNRASAEYLVHFLQQHEEVYHSHLIGTFMEFTNDMDVSRNQSFAAVHPDLVALLKESGHPWVYQTRFAKPKAEPVGCGG
jgi:MoaA/NifB/PqqE/SkfB family radical SAM enzyme